MISVKVGTSYKNVTKMWVKSSSGWKLVTETFVKVGQTFKKV